MFFYTLPLTILTLLYLATLFKLRTGFSKLAPGKNKMQPAVSVIIAARNEAQNIEKCLRAVLAQNYPKDKLEIIIVDDRSEDTTAEIVNDLARKYPRLSLLQVRELSSDLAPKKRAVDLGIRKAQGEIIVTTDADCEPGRFWISELIKHFEPKVGMVAGYNPYITGEATIFHRILAVDYFAMACVAAASSGLKYPISCSGGNLAYRKELYFQLGGFKQIGNWVSGDDDFFLEQAREKTDWEIRYAIHPKSFVPTLPPQDLKSFVNQRIRYASKGRHYSLPVTLGLIGVYFINVLLAIGPVISIFIPSLFPVWLSGFLLKFISEFYFLKKGGEVFQQTFRFTPFFLASLLHPLYIALAGFLGQFAGFEWKDNRYSGKIKSPVSISGEMN